MVVMLEFWPEYNSGPLWSEGKSADLASFPLPAELRDRLAAWNERYDDSKLSSDEGGDSWLREGRELLHQIRAALGDEYQVVVTEPWWGEQPST